MTHVSEALTSPVVAPSSAQPNIQDLFLNQARRDRVSVSIHLMDGREFDARIKSFDRFAVVVEVDASEYLLFKHAISSIGVPRSATNYRAPLQS
jgi:host factor-I protein